MGGDVGGAVGAGLDQAGAGGEGEGELVEASEAVVGEVEERGGALDRDAAGGAEQGLELLGVERLLLGEEVEDAAASVVDDEDADRDFDVAERARPPMS